MLLNDTTATERWLPVVGFESLYEVSDCGHVRRAARGKGTRPGRALKPRKTVWGYVRVALYGGRKRWQQFSIHSLVLAAFVGPRPPEHDIDHFDFDRVNNRLENLRYISRGDNIRRTRDAGRGYVGMRSGRVKLTDDDIRVIRSLRGKVKQRDVAEQYGVARSLIGRIMLRQSWKHVA